jgi:acetyltransferase-like isoleucine patch superfamily enzyme
MNKRPVIFVGVRGDFSFPMHLTNTLGIPVAGILDKYYYGNTKSVFDIPIIGSEDQLLDPTDPQAKDWRENYDFFVTSYWTGSQHLNDVGLDNEQIRKDRIALVERAGVNLINLIDPSCLYTPGHNIKMGRGILIANLVGFRSNITIGDFCSIDSFTTLGHDVQLAKNVSVGSRCILSSAIIDENARLGVRSTVVGGIDNKGKPLHVGAGSTVWMGVTLMKNLPPDSIAVPPMHRILSKHQKEQ